MLRFVFGGQAILTVPNSPVRSDGVELGVMEIENDIRCSSYWQMVRMVSNWVSFNIGRPPPPNPLEEGTAYPAYPARAVSRKYTPIWNSHNMSKTFKNTKARPCKTL